MTEVPEWDSAIEFIQALSPADLECAARDVQERFGVLPLDAKTTDFEAIGRYLLENYAERSVGGEAT